MSVHHDIQTISILLEELRFKIGMLYEPQDNPMTSALLNIQEGFEIELEGLDKEYKQRRVRRAYFLGAIFLPESVQLFPQSDPRPGADLFARDVMADIDALPTFEGPEPSLDN